MATDGRFGGDKGIFGGFGTGSAGPLAPGSASIREVVELFQGGDEAQAVLQVGGWLGGWVGGVWLGRWERQ
jgi:hypothetical protein